MKRSLVALAALAVLLFTTAQPATAGGQKPSGELTVFAAASLTESFDAIGKQFENKYPDVDVKFNYDASSNLATQINQGAPADVFASADQGNLQKTVDAGTVTPPPVVFAKNRLEIAVEKGNPKKIKTLADLQKSGLVVVLCADQVPCGKYAAESLRKAGVTITPASKEENAKATLSKVSIGEADASIVYVTDVKAAQGTTASVKIPDTMNVNATYPMAAVKQGQNQTAARAWEQFVMSKDGQKTLRKFGFLPP
jgi:molybdate transport system substrate-binding protein